MDCLGILFFVFIIFMVTKNSAQRRNQQGEERQGQTSSSYARGNTGQYNSTLLRGQEQPIQHKVQAPRYTNPEVENADAGDILTRANQNVRDVHQVGQDAETLYREQREASMQKRPIQNMQRSPIQNMQTAQPVHQPLNRTESQMKSSVIANSTRDMEAWSVNIQAGSELMKQVEDLMITGYNGKLTYERDFVSEGIEMLNSFEV